MAYKPLRDAPRIAALITAIGVSFFLEYFGALNFVFSPRNIPYQRPFDVVTWSISASGIIMLQPGMAAPPNGIVVSNIFLFTGLAAVLVQLACSSWCTTPRWARPCGPPPSTSPQPG